MTRLAQELVERTPHAGGPAASVDRGIRENEALKASMAELLVDAREWTNRFDAAVGETTLELVRAQLRRQLDREAELIPQALLQPVYEIGLTRSTRRSRRAAQPLRSGVVRRRLAGSGRAR